MISKSRRNKKKTSNKGLKVFCNCLKCQRFPLRQNLVSISTRTRHRKKYPQVENIQSSNDEQEMSDVELSANEQIINDQNTQSSNDEQEMSDVELSAIINDQNTQSSNEEQEMSDVELSANEQILNDQMLNNTKIVDQESLINYELNF
ncbi:hypothetical protein F8M41_004062 [Gigaspora margarita]|uniref:Uncharacterized protein n=1 Tax=Gigaspora margarita TaxID=4874 RepID=A0A8H3XBM7_GIGMA|nr:hypothetical protein F8M41_004062 [Gigaspora margarita]